VPSLLTVDKLKAAVVKADRYEGLSAGGVEGEVA
jgi:hypothetical protein